MSLHLVSLPIANPRNYYLPSLIPVEANIATNHYAENDFENLVNHIHKKRHKAGLKKIDVKHKLHQIAIQNGMSTAQGEGFFGSLWKHIKNIGKNIIDDPKHAIDTVTNIVNSIAPLIKATE